MKHHYKISIKGKVQGVFYRGSTKQKAEQLGIVGFVRNEMNGDVYVEVEADEEILTQFVEWCKQEPENAVVENVLVDHGSLQNFIKFEIRRD